MPPIVMDGVLTVVHQFLGILRKEYNITNIQVKYTRYNTLLYINSQKNYHNILKHVKKDAAREKEEDQVYFHTYTPRTEKTCIHN